MLTCIHSPNHEPRVYHKPMNFRSRSNVYTFSLEAKRDVIYVSTTGVFRINRQDGFYLTVDTHIQQGTDVGYGLIFLYTPRANKGLVNISSVLLGALLGNGSCRTAIRVSWTDTLFRSPIHRWFPWRVRSPAAGRTLRWGTHRRHVCAGESPG